jgi:malate/lactate dehydrogenase
MKGEEIVIINDGVKRKNGMKSDEILNNND